MSELQVEPLKPFFPANPAEIEPLDSIEQGAESKPANTAHFERRYDQIFQALRCRCNHQIHQLAETDPVRGNGFASPMKLQGAPCRGWKGQGIQ